MGLFLISYFVILSLCWPDESGNQTRTINMGPCCKCQLSGKSSREYKQIKTKVIKYIPLLRKPEIWIIVSDLDDLPWGSLKIFVIVGPDCMPCSAWSCLYSLLVCWMIVCNQTRRIIRVTVCKLVCQQKQWKI